MIRGIDHLVIACEDPDAAAAELESMLGITSTGGGRHEAHGTRNRIVWLADGSYLELIGVEDPSRAAESPVGAASMRALESGGGLATWAALVDDADAAVTALDDAGATYGPSVHGSRRRDDGELVEWWTAFPGDDLSPTVPFLIQHATTGAEWGPAAREARASFAHPIGSPVRLLRLALAVDDPATTAAEIGASLQLPPRAAADLAVLDIGPHELRLHPRREMAVPAAVTLGAGIATPASIEVLGVRIGAEPVDAPVTSGTG